MSPSKKVVIDTRRLEKKTRQKKQPMPASIQDASPKPVRGRPREYTNRNFTIGEEREKQLRGLIARLTLRLERNVKYSEIACAALDDLLSMDESAIAARIER